MAHSTRLLTPIATLACVFGAFSCSSVNHTEKETKKILAARVAAQVSLTPLQDFSSKPIKLHAGRLDGVSDEILSQVDVIARPGPESALLLNCHGRSWRYDGARVTLEEIKVEQPRFTPHSEEANNDIRAKGTCRLQVEQGTYWSIQPNKEKLLLSRLTLNHDGYLVQNHPPEQIHAGTGREPFLPLAVTSSLIAFAESNAIAFYEAAPVLELDPEATPSKNISVTRFHWDDGRYGLPLTAGRMGDGYWILTRKNIVWFAARSDELRQSEWLQVETFPVRFDEALRDAVSEKGSTVLNLYIDDRTNLKSISADLSLTGVVFLSNR